MMPHIRSRLTAVWLAALLAWTSVVVPSQAAPVINEPVASPTVSTAPQAARELATPRVRPTRTPRPTPKPDAGCTGPFRSVSKPLTDLGNGEYVRLDSGPTGFRGGLYPNGSNVRPPAHEAAGVAIARQIVPLDEKGRPNRNGKIGLISIGMSNTSIEFGRFEDNAHKRTDINPQVAIFNGALGSQTAEKWADPKGRPWPELAARMKDRKLSPQQVQVVWIKQTLTRGGPFPGKAEELEKDLLAILYNLKAEFPNLKIAYISSRTRSYTYTRGLSPEPNAFETGFAVKWLVEKQINGDPALNFDAKRGPVRAPYIAWGPYLWIDGENPRLDGRTWTTLDLEQDCTHPSPSGAAKVADMLLNFFMTDTTAAPWFRARP
jgi:hypothetical protein